VTLILIRNANLYAPQPLGIRHLLLGGGRILWVGDEAFDLPVPLRAVSRIVDAAGRVTIPGLIDGHVHVTGGGGEAGFRTRVPALPLSRFTTAGITTVVGLLGTDDVAPLQGHCRRSGRRMGDHTGRGLTGRTTISRPLTRTSARF